jgi:hypothetical protein
MKSLQGSCWWKIGTGISTSTGSAISSFMGRERLREMLQVGANR